jgi:lupus La protein
MSDAVTKEQPEVAAAAPEAQAVEETSPAAATTEEIASSSKTASKPDSRESKKNRKYDPTTQPVSDDPIKIRGQVCHPMP